MHHQWSQFFVHIMDHFIVYRSRGLAIYQVCTASRLRIGEQSKIKMNGHLVFRTVVLLFLTSGKFYSFIEYPLKFICYCLMCLLQ